MRGAFTGGVLAGLHRRGIAYNFFDYYVGSSAGGWNIAYYLTDQIDEGLRIWLKHLPNGFIKWRGLKPFNDLAYLEKIAREIEPLSVDAIRNRKEQAFVTLSDPETLKDHYININRALNPIRVLVAGSAMPFFSGPIVIDDKTYYDGGLTAAIPLRKAETEGADKIWVVATTPTGYRRKNLLWKIASWLEPFNPQVRQLLAQRPILENKMLEEIEKRNDIRVIRPEQNLPVHWRSNDLDAIRATVKIGKEAAERLLAQLR